MIRIFISNTPFPIPLTSGSWGTWLGERDDWGWVKTNDKWQSEEDDIQQTRNLVQTPNTLQGLCYHYALSSSSYYRWQRLHLFWIAQFLTIKTKLKTSRNTTWQYINRSNDDDDVHHSILHHHHHNHHEYHQHCYDDGDHSNYMIIIQTTHSLLMKPFKFIIKTTSPLDLQLWRRPICWYAKRQLIWWLVHKIISPYAKGIS